MSAIGAQSGKFGKSVENTVATAQGAVTTGQGKNVSGHMVYATQVGQHVAEMDQYDIVNTNLKPYLKSIPPNLPAPHTLQTSQPLLRYTPAFEAISLSIDIGLPRNRQVRMQMFVRGPYMGLHRYVASVDNTTLHDSASRATGLAVDYDMQNGLLDPVTLYWRPPLFHASYTHGYYSFMRESVLIYNALGAWNAAIELGRPAALAAGAAVGVAATHAQRTAAHMQQEIAWQIDADAIMASRFRWQNAAVAGGFVYPKPAGAPVAELDVPWQWPIATREDDVAVRQYPSI